ncbi:ATP-binding protein [Fontibacillus sp. BL9]|uniref:HAMP domain-containing sensor histidine kinase n=1 Tax=Fontibacillus sp. BL9 TaxID=3389971 RepID=UPI00397C93AC
MKSGTKKVLKVTWNIAKHILQLIALFVLLAVCWTGAVYITKALYVYTGSPHSDYLVQLINFILGIILFICCMLFLSIYFHRKEMAMLKAIIDAMRRISKGDFSVKLEYRSNQREFEKIAQSINEMAGELGRMETMRQDFISNVSHEIQSPLTSIQGFAEALRNPGLSEEKRAHYLDIIERESLRLSQMSDNLLKLSSLESDPAEFETSRYRLDRQLQAVVLASEPQWIAKNIFVELDLQEAEIVAAEDLLRQVWVNLLHNSIKFTPPGGQVVISLVKRENEAEITISDTGIGIDESDVPRLFERFYKADRSRNRSVGGSGLGLSIVKKIVDIHRGDITVQSTPGQGTIFITRIPCVWEKS